MSRKSRSNFSHGTGVYLANNQARLSEFGRLTRYTEYHWQLVTRVGGHMLNWWPAKGRWQFCGEQSRTGTFETMLDVVTALEHKAAREIHANETGIDCQPGIELLVSVDRYTPDGSPIYTWPLSLVPE